MNASHSSLTDMDLVVGAPIFKYEFQWLALAIKPSYMPAVNVPEFSLKSRILIDYINFIPIQFYIYQVLKIFLIFLANS